MESITSGMGSMGLSNDLALQSRRLRGFAGLPEEMVDKILEELLASTRSGATQASLFKNSCSALSLTCKALAVPSQRALLSRVQVYVKDCQAFNEFARRKKGLSTMVKQLNLVVANHIDEARAFVFLRGIHLHWETVADIKVTFLRPTFNKTYASERKHLRDFLNGAKVKRLTLANFVGRNVKNLPSRAVDQIVLAFSTDEREIIYENFSLPPGPLAASEITICDLVCQQELSGPPYNLLRSSSHRSVRGLSKVEAKELKFMTGISPILGSPGSLALERCRVYPRLLRSILETKLGNGLVTLRLDQLVQRRRDDSEVIVGRINPYSLTSLVNLRHLLLGAIDNDLITHSPPALTHLTLLYVNAFGAIAWLLEVIDTSTRPATLPLGCSIKVLPHAACVKHDGPIAVQDVRKATERSEIFLKTREADECLALNGRSLETGSFESAALRVCAGEKQEVDPQLGYFWKAKGRQQSASGGRIYEDDSYDDYDSDYGYE